MGGASTGKKRPGRKQTTGSETAAGTRVGHGQLSQRGPPRGPQRGGVDGGTGHRAEGAHSWPRGKGTHWGKTLAAELWTQPHAQDRGRKRPRHRALYFVMVTDVHAQPHRQTLRMKEPPPSTPMTMVPAAAAEGRGRVGGGGQRSAALRQNDPMAHHARPGCGHGGRHDQPQGGHRRHTRTVSGCRPSQEDNQPGRLLSWCSDPHLHGFPEGESERGKLRAGDTDAEACTQRSPFPADHTFDVTAQRLSDGRRMSW